MSPPRPAQQNDRERGSYYESCTSAQESCRDSPASWMGIAGGAAGGRRASANVRDGEMSADIRWIRSYVVVEPDGSLGPLEITRRRAPRRSASTRRARACRPTRSSRSRTRSSCDRTRSLSKPQVGGGPCATDRSARRARRVRSRAGTDPVDAAMAHCPPGGAICALDQVGDADRALDSSARGGCLPHREPDESRVGWRPLHLAGQDERSVVEPVAACERISTASRLAVASSIGWRTYWVQVSGCRLELLGPWS